MSKVEWLGRNCTGPAALHTYRVEIVCREMGNAGIVPHVIFYGTRNILLWAVTRIT